jgi:hypothetical protein
MRDAESSEEFTVPRPSLAEALGTAVAPFASFSSQDAPLRMAALSRTRISVILLSLRFVVIVDQTLILS